MQNVLEKMHTEAFLEFQQLHPDVKVKHRKFESLKPFFVKQTKESVCAMTPQHSFHN